MYLVELLLIMNSFLASCRRKGLYLHFLKLHMGFACFLVIGAIFFFFVYLKSLHFSLSGIASLHVVHLLSFDVLLLKAKFFRSLKTVVQVGLLIHILLHTRCTIRPHLVFLLILVYVCIINLFFVLSLYMLNNHKR